MRLASITLRPTLRLSRCLLPAEEIAPKRSKRPPEKRGWGVPRPGLGWRRQGSEPAAGSTRPPSSGSPPPPPSPPASGFSFAQSSDFGESPNPTSRAIRCSTTTRSRKNSSPQQPHSRTSYPRRVGARSARIVDLAAQGIRGGCTRSQLIYQADCWRNIAVTFIDLRMGFECLTGQSE
jgi:hypothetical protein